MGQTNTSLSLCYRVPRETEKSTLTYFNEQYVRQLTLAQWLSYTLNAALYTPSHEIMSDNAVGWVSYVQAQKQLEEKDHGWSFRKHFVKVRKRGGLGWNDNIMVSYGHGHTTLNHICNVHAPTPSGHFQVYWRKTLCVISKKSLNQKVFIQHLVLISWGDFLVAMCLNVSEKSVVHWGSHDCSLFSRQGLKMSRSLQR